MFSCVFTKLRSDRPSSMLQLVFSGQSGASAVCAVTAIIPPLRGSNISQTLIRHVRAAATSPRLRDITRVLTDSASRLVGWLVVGGLQRLQAAASLHCTRLYLKVSGWRFVLTHVIILDVVTSSSSAAALLHRTGWGEGGWDAPESYFGFMFEGNNYKDLNRRCEKVKGHRTHVV